MIKVGSDRALDVYRLNLSTNAAPRCLRPGIARRCDYYQSNTA